MALSRTSTAGLVIGVAALDLATKAAAFSSLPAGSRAGPIFPLLNEDALLGVVRGSSVSLVGIGLLVLAGFWATCVHLVRQRRIAAWVPAVFAGGVSANLLDRAVTGSVHDWLVVGGTVVNLADVAVVVAVLGYTIGLLRSRRRAAAVGSIPG